MCHWTEATVIQKQKMLEKMLEVAKQILNTSILLFEEHYHQAIIHFLNHKSDHKNQRTCGVNSLLGLKHALVPC